MVIVGLHNLLVFFFFFFNDTATTEIYTTHNTLSLHDALPICDRALLGAGRLVRFLVQRSERLVDLGGRVRDLVELAVGELAVVPDRRAPHELADLLRILGRDLLRDVGEHPADELPRLVERRQALLLGPGREAAGPELVVLVEVPLLALREVVTAAREPVLERGELLVAVDVDALRLGANLVLKIGEVGGSLLVVDRGDDRSGEVEHLLKLLRSDVEEVADTARHALEEPDVRDGRSQVDVTHALAPDLLARHLDAAALADDALVADALVLAAVALPVLGRTEDALAEEPVLLGLQRPVVDRLRLRDLAGGPISNLLARREADADCVEVVDVDQVSLYSSSSMSAKLGASSNGPASSSASSLFDSPATTASVSSTSPSCSSAGSVSSPSWSTRSCPSSVSSAVGCRAAARSEPGERSMPSSSAARSSSSSSSRTSTSPPSSEMTLTSSARDCISFRSTLKDSGMDGSAMFSPFTIAS